MPAESRNDIHEHDNIFDVLPPTQLFDDMTPEVLEEIYLQCAVNKALGEYSLLIVDDFQERLKDKTMKPILEKFILKMRHVYCSVIILQQNYKGLSNRARANANVVITFKNNKPELEQIFEEVFDRKKQDFEDLVRLGFKNEHDWVALQTRRGHAYAGFDRIEFDDDGK
jgi:hypothetical protein